MGTINSLNRFAAVATDGINACMDQALVKQFLLEPGDKAPKNATAAEVNPGWVLFRAVRR